MPSRNSTNTTNIWHQVASNSHEGVVVASGQVQLQGASLFNAHSEDIYVKLYDTSTQPDNSFNPKLIFGVAANGGGREVNFPHVLFQNGLAIRVVTGLSLSDNTTVPDETVIVNLIYG